MQAVGKKADSLGCEVCRPAVGSILSSLYNDWIMNPQQRQTQDTNDRYLANVQRDGTYSVVPRLPAGEVTPAGLKVIGEVAEEYGLYTKITGGQRIDMFGAKKQICLRSGRSSSTPASNPVMPTAKRCAR